MGKQRIGNNRINGRQINIHNGKVSGDTAFFYIPANPLGIGIAGNPYRPSFDPIESGFGFLSIIKKRAAPRMPAPFQFTIVMIMGEKAAPETGNFVIGKSNVIDGNSSPGKAA